MAANALDIVSLETMKSELRIPAAEGDHDTLLTGQIAAAVSFVSRHLRIPLLDQDEQFYCSRPSSSSAPIILATAGVRSVVSVEYWTVGGALREAPGGSINVSTLGRLVEYCGFVIYPPAAGWPLILDDSVIEIVVTRGQDTPPALRAAVILCVRQFYDGYRRIRATEAFFALVGPFRAYR